MQMSSKHMNRRSAVTLDLKHKEFLNEFSKDEIQVDQHKEEIQALKRQLVNEQDLSVEDQLNLKDRIAELKATIREIKMRKKEYLLDNSSLIFEYFENKKNISTGTNKQAITNKSKLVNNFFKIKESRDEKATALQKNSQNIVLQYLTNVNADFLDMSQYVYPADVCQVCHKGELVSLEEDGLMVCTMCSRSVRCLVENEKPSYKEPPKEVCFYAYKRINHFKEILAQFQGKETTQIPDEVIENIKMQIKKERMGLAQITNAKTKEILKKLGYNKYYEHIPFIKEKLGIKPPIMTPELEETLCNLFVELQAPYSKYCPDNRVNFLNYYYTAYKLCELLGETKYLEHFPMLKDPEKRMEQDIIWRNICHELDWEFIPTN